MTAAWSEGANNGSCGRTIGRGGELSLMIKIMCRPKVLTLAQEGLVLRRSVEINPANAEERHTVERTPVGRRGGPRRLAVVIGRTCKNVHHADALNYVLGYTCANDVSARDWQKSRGGSQWCRGKSFDTFAPLGPCLVTPDELPGGVRPALDVRLTVDGEVMQSDTTGDLLFDPVDLVEYVSTVTRLHPGDIIATGTPGGVGHARTPARYLTGGEVVVTEIEGIGRLENRVVAEKSA